MKTDRCPLEAFLAVHRSSPALPGTTQGIQPCPGHAWVASIAVLHPPAPNDSMGEIEITGAEPCGAHRPSARWRTSRSANNTRACAHHRDGPRQNRLRQRSTPTSGSSRRIRRTPSATDRIIKGAPRPLPLDVYQTGSGHQQQHERNEVLASLAGAHRSAGHPTIPSAPASRATMLSRPPSRGAVEAVTAG